MTQPPPPALSARAPVIAATAAALIAGLGAWWTASRIAGLEARIVGLVEDVVALQRTARLIRIEGQSQGRGIGAVIEQIEFWAPQLSTSATSHPAAVRIEASLGECLDAIGALGEDAFGPLLAALESPAPRDDETRKWLLRGLLRASSGDGRGLLAAVLRGTRLAPTPRLRFFAADELLRLDKDFAGEVLAQILQVESSQGISRQVPPALAPEYERVIGTNAFPEFFNLIERFVQSGHPQTAQVLQMILGRQEHDRMTYQECIRALGRLGARDALPRIKELYSRPPHGEFNPLFLNVCLQAIAEIEGPGACEFLRAELRRVDIPVVSTKLQELLKDHCGDR
jgi:hypothetical protein